MSIVFISGSRHGVKEYESFCKGIIYGILSVPENRIIVGDNPLGVDKLVQDVAYSLSLPVTVYGISREPRYQAKRDHRNYRQIDDVSYFGRDQHLANDADIGIFLWTGHHTSRGTIHAYNYMKDMLDKPSYLYKLKDGRLEFKREKTR